MERDALPIVEILPKRSKVPIIGPIIDHFRTRTEVVTRFTMPETRAQEVADSRAEALRKNGLDARAKTIPSDQNTF